MTNLVKWVQRSPGGAWPQISLDQAISQFGQFGFQGLGYGPSLIQTIQQNKETIQSDYLGFINGAYKTNGIIFALMLTRSSLFSEARFQFRRLNKGRPGKLFGTDDLAILENPWPNGTTGDLLARAITDVDLSGNFYATKVVDRKMKSGIRLARLRPDWVTIVLGSTEDANLSQFDPTAELLGYIYQPGGTNSGLQPKIYAPDEVAHWAPIPDPMAHYRGMSWIQPILTEILGDRAMTTHKQMYFENGATPNLVVSMETGKMDRRTFQEWIDAFENERAGAINAYKTLYLGQGATATVVGNNVKDLDYAVVQGHGETRVSAAAGVPAIVVGFSEGLESATYSNFSQARRVLADKTLRPLWRNFCASMEVLITVPGGSMLWYDDRDIAFLKADEKDNADVQLTKATAMRLLVDAGFDADSIVEAIESNDMSLLTHSGLYSVQLQPPGSSDQKPEPAPAPAAAPTSNGSSGNGSGSSGTGSAGSIGSASSDHRALVAQPMELAKALIGKRKEGDS